MDQSSAPPVSRHRLLNSSRVRARLGDISDMTLSRWMRNPSLGFPEPVIINGRRYWQERDLIAWEQSRPTKGEAA